MQSYTAFWFTGMHGDYHVLKTVAIWPFHQVNDGLRWEQTPQRFHFVTSQNETKQGFLCTNLSNKLLFFKVISTIVTTEQTG